MTELILLFFFFFLIHEMLLFLCYCWSLVYCQMVTVAYFLCGFVHFPLLLVYKDDLAWIFVFMFCVLFSSS